MREMLMATFFDRIKSNSNLTIASVLVGLPTIGYLGHRLLQWISNAELFEKVSNCFKKCFSCCIPKPETPPAEDPEGQFKSLMPQYSPPTTPITRNSSRSYEEETQLFAQNYNDSIDFLNKAFCNGVILDSVQNQKEIFQRKSPAVQTQILLLMLRLAQEEGKKGNFDYYT